MVFCVLCTPTGIGVALKTFATCTGSGRLRPLRELGRIIHKEALWTRQEESAMD